MAEAALDDDKLPAISMVLVDPVATAAEGRATIIRWMTVAAEVRRMVCVAALMILRYGVW